MSEVLIDRFKKFQEVYQPIEDERLVLIAAQTLETLLTKALKKYFIPSFNGSDELFDQGKALETFRAKIHMAYRVGLVSQGLSEDLLLVREIRKKFRSEIDCRSLNFKSVGELCARFKAPGPLKAEFPDLEKVFADTPRGRFELTAVVLSTFLEDIVFEILRVPEHPFY